jgi:sulfoxide reductase heme-binding subunit YedZ
MSVQYGAIGWNRQKKLYDYTLLSCLSLYLAIFLGVGFWRNPYATAETLLIRALGTAALLLLHVVLCIGPLARLDRRFLPLLYNRRHLGVTTFLLGLAHGVFALVQFHALGNVNPLVSLFISNPRYNSVAQFPFQALGFFALIILFLMAATSHDFWLRNLTAPTWKRLHMMVYVAYGLLIAHVVLGALQSERSPVLAAALGVGLATVLSLHLLAGWKERGIDIGKTTAKSDVVDGFVEVCKAESIPEKCAKVVSLSGERIAVFKYDGKVSAVSNVCQHQNGPLGEGRILDGCITCPWHGYQYGPENGSAPAPFKEKIPTFEVKVVDGAVLVHPRPNAPGTYVEPAKFEVPEGIPMSEFYVGYIPKAPTSTARFIKKLVAGLALCSLVIAMTLVLSQMPFARSIFEFGNLRSFDGIVTSRPYPMLLVPRPGSDAFSQYLLVAPGKHGADTLVAAFEDKHVRLRGQLIYRDGQTMVELDPKTIAVVEPKENPALETADLGTATLTGEIVDSKCYFGVMNPGRGKVHRDCATRCLSGGIPPVLLTSSGEIVLLVNHDGKPFAQNALREFVDEVVVVRGNLIRRGDIKMMQAENIKHTGS